MSRKKNRKAKKNNSKTLRIVATVLIVIFALLIAFPVALCKTAPGEEAKAENITTLALAGGVAANSEIRRKFFELEKEGYKVYAPPMKYCTDNASMVASSAYFLANTMDDLTQEVFSRMK